MLKNNIVTALVIGGEIIPIGKAVGSEFPESQQLNEAAQAVWGSQAIPWPEDLCKLARLLELNPWHNACCRVKAQDITSQGWRIEDEKGKTEGAPKELLDFFNQCNPKLSLAQVLKRCWIDFEATGNFTLEVARQRGGKKLPAALYHAPAHTIKKVKGGKYVQKRGADIRYFLEFGAVDQQTKGLNELITHQNYTPRSSFYGLPDVIAAVGAITGHVKQRDANIKYYENSMMAEFAIIIEGGSLDEDVEKVIRETLQDMRGSNQAHKTLVLSAGGDNVKIKIEKLTPELNYTQQRLYRLDNRDEVIQAHRVPPKLIGVEDRVGGLAQSQGVQLEIYYENVVVPNQKDLGHLLTNTIIQQGFGMDGWKIVFTAKALEDKKVNADVDKIYLDGGVLKPNEVREIRFTGLPPLPEEDKPAVSKILKADGTDLQTRDIEAALLAKIRPHLETFRDNAAGYLANWDGTIKRFSKGWLRGIFRKADPEKIILDQMMQYLEGQWAAVAVPLAEAVYEAKVAGGERAVAVQYAKLGISKDFKLTNAKLMEYYQNEAAADIKGVGENAMARIRAALVTSSENGEVVVGQLSERVKAVLDDIPASRAELIAEQEVTNAYSYLQHESRVRLGIKSKQWITQGDDLVRPHHQAMSGRIVGVSMYFVLPDGSMGLYPRDRSLSAAESIRCRCDVREIADTGWDIPADPWGGD